MSGTLGLYAITLGICGLIHVAERVLTGLYQTGAI